MSLVRLIGAFYFDWLPVGPAYLYPFVSLKIKPTILKLVLVFVSQTYIDSLIFPYFNKDYGEKLDVLKDGNHQNYDIYINALICLSFCLITELVPHLGLENKRKLAKAKLTENPNEPSKAVGETHVLIYMIFVCATYSIILFGLNQLNIMYSPVSCYVPSDRVHEIIAVQHDLSKDFGCHAGAIHILNDVLAIAGNSIAYIFMIGPLNLFLKI